VGNRTRAKQNLNSQKERE